MGINFLMFLLPLPLVWCLRVRRVQNVLLVFVFALGFFVCAISITHIVLMTPLAANPGPGFTYSGISILYWNDVETNLAIVVASAITLKPPVDDGRGAGGDLHNNHSWLRIFDPITTLRSRLDPRVPAVDGSAADDIKALRSAQFSHASSRLDAQSISGGHAGDEETAMAPRVPPSLDERRIRNDNDHQVMSDAAPG
ncbi:hypothetical protein SCUCBS95973_005539 [Sporothrix curviconia]|uniref:Rhodopsin domain-containing protein n=1 Tax=Sporothrix curviconia TaxID=1260050 RepID=A0ABP0BXT7_9PEZI